MTPFAWLLASYSTAMDVVCANDPPPMPDFSNFNPTDLLGGVFNPAFEPARAKIAAAFENWLWNRFCFCSSGQLVTPPVRTVPAPLSLAVSASSNTTPCFTGGWGGLPPALQGGSFQIGQSTDVTQLVLPVAPGRLTIVSEGVPFTAYQVPAGPSLIRGTGKTPNPVQTIFGPIAAVDFWTFDTVGRVLGHFSFVDSMGRQLFDAPFPIDPTWIFWYAGAYNRVIPGDPPADGPIQLTTTVFCGGLGPQSIQSCCPPDPAIANTLQAILASIQGIPSDGGLPPGSYVDTVNHAGLTNMGRIAIQRNTVACRVLITTDNNQLPVGPGNPPYLFNRGFIVPIVSTGGVRGNVRLTYNPQTYVLPQLTEQIGYTLTESLVASIIEMIPGP